MDNDGDGSYPPICFGNDCNDLDPALEGLDADGDGYSTCDGDCDDTDATLESGDLDGDGVSTCDGDCDDTNIAINPNASDANLDV